MTPRCAGKLVGRWPLAGEGVQERVDVAGVADGALEGADGAREGAVPRHVDAPA